MTDERLIEENRTLSLRLQIAQAFTTFLLEAYDALLYHGVNYRTLPEYDPEAISEAADQPLTVARGRLFTLFERLTNGVSAAIRRKSFKKV